MSFNPFVTATPVEPTAATPAPTPTPVPTAVPAPPQSTDALAGLEDAAGGDGKKTRKPRVRRSEKNTIITKEQKNEILKRYKTENPANIARDLGLEARQVYNIVRNSRLKLEKMLEDPAITEEQKAKIQNALSQIPHKEFGGGAAGPRANSLTEDDIISALLS